MKKAVLLACLTLFQARALLLEASAAAKEATCTNGKNAVAEVAAPTALTVYCPESHTLNPQSKTQVFKTVQCDEPGVDLASLVPGATLQIVPNNVQKSSLPRTSSSQSEKYTFTVVQMPPAAVSVFYLCTKADSTEHGDKGLNTVQTKSKGGATAGEERCTIEIQIAAANPLGPNTCAVEGGKIGLDLRAVKETARFSCSQGVGLFPQSATKAYDSTCSKEVDLPHGLARRQENSEYYLDLKELPKRAEQLCYLCRTTKANKSQSEGCQVHVRTAGGAPGGASRAGARGTTALRLALLAATCLYIN